MSNPIDEIADSLAAIRNNSDDIEQCVRDYGSAICTVLYRWAVREGLAKKGEKLGGIEWEGDWDE